MSDSDFGWQPIVRMEIRLLSPSDNDFNYNKLNASDVRLFLQEVLDMLFGVGYQIDVRK